MTETERPEAERTGTGTAEREETGTEPSEMTPPGGTGRLRALIRGRGSRRGTGVVLAVAVLVVGLAWALASPVGGSPDDDFHLGSIWCPRPIDSSGCRTRVEDGEVRVQVPQRVGASRDCYFFHPEISAGCQLSLSDDKQVYSRRYDDGGYPTGYYRFHHMFVGDNVARSAIVMRGVNLLIAVALLGGIGLVLPPWMRERYALAIILSWMPMGIYFVASNNPSSWALTGVLGYAAGMYGSVRVAGRRRWVLLGLSLVGAVLACSCRGDAAFYLFVVSLAVFAGIRWRRRILVQAATALVVSVIGVWTMLGTGQARSGVSTEFFSDLPDHTRLMVIIFTLPEYFAGFYGRRWGAGWFDVPFDGPVTIIALVLAGAAVFAGVRRLGWRKIVSAGILAGALLGIPVVLSYGQGLENVYRLQPRYLLPLLVPFFIVWLDQRRRSAVLSAPQTALVVVLSAIAHGYALHRILLRYTHGLHNYGEMDAGWLPFNLDFKLEWWWRIPISPMTLWIVATAMYAVALTSALLLVRPRSDRGAGAAASDDCGTTGSDHPRTRPAATGESRLHEPRPQSET